MSQPLHIKCKNMILGALVADAAAMGLHWIYDQDHIRKIAPDAPEFKTPDPRNFEGVPAYFAHPTKVSGELSQYGEQVMVMLRTLSKDDGQFCPANFADQFRAHFGYGGAYVGYIDHATRDMLDNQRRFEDAVNACALDVPFEGDLRVRKALVAKVLPLLARHSGDDLTEAFKVSVRETYTDEAAVEFGARLLDTVKSIAPATGATDIQLPAIAKLPALVAMLCLQGNTGGTAFSKPVASAIKTTSNHPTAATFGMAGAQMMAAALLHGNSNAVIEATRSTTAPEVNKLLEQAVEMQGDDNATVTKHFGMACDMPFGVPSAAHNIATATSFSDAIRRNIYGGGDSCGRAILVGAVMGATCGIGGDEGIPQAWIDRLDVKDDADALLEKLFA